MVYLYALLGMLCWGLAPLFGKLGLYKVNPVTALSLRTIMAATVVWVWVLSTKGIQQFAQIPPLYWLFIGIEAFLATLLGDLAYFAALKKGNINEVSFIMACAPLITMLTSFFFLSEIITLYQIIGAVCITVGLIFISIH